MSTYLTIITTILVLTQIIRIVQNAVNLRNQNKVFRAELGQLEDITNADLATQRKAYRLMVEYLEQKLEKE